MLSDTFYRITAPVLDRIPDLSHQPAGRQVTIGIVASLVFHVLILSLALLFGLLFPEHALISFARSKPKLQEIELTVIRPVPAAAEPQPRLVTIEEISRAKPFLDSRGLSRSERAPESPLLESDVDMVAASELPALGNVPLPSQEGRTDREFPAFATHQVTLGAGASPSSPTSPAPEIPNVPSPPPESMAPPVQKADTAAVKPPIAKPVDAKKRSDTAKAGSDQIALSAKTKAFAKATPPATNAPAPPIPAAPAMRTTDSLALLSTPAPRPKPQQAGFQPQLEKTRVEGSITNRGSKAVDAIGTPLARYKKAVNDAIGSRWYHYVHQRMDLIAGGSVRISFTIEDDGHVTGMKVESNTANRAFADVCESAVRDAEIAPLPPAVAEPLLDRELDYTLTFTFHSF